MARSDARPPLSLGTVVTFPRAGDVGRIHAYTRVPGVLRIITPSGFTWEAPATELVPLPGVDVYQGSAWYRGARDFRAKAAARYQKSG